MHQYAPHRVRELRLAAGLRRERVAVEFDRSAEAIRAWEDGRGSPSARQLAKLADLLQCQPGEFFAEQVAQ
jgi:transcriptional regulator with XRE-family HTH domain